MIAVYAVLAVVLMLVSYEYATAKLRAQFLAYAPACDGSDRAACAGWSAGSMPDISFSGAPHISPPVFFGVPP